MSTTKPPFPPFDLQTALQKVQAAEDAWNTCDPVTVALAYAEDSVWRNRDQFITGRAEIVEFLRQMWQREQDYALSKELWSFRGEPHRRAVPVRVPRPQRSMLAQLWQRIVGVHRRRLMRRREASVNDVPITRATGGFAALAVPASVDCRYRSGEPEIANIRGDFDE